MGLFGRGFKLYQRLDYWFKIIQGKTNNSVFDCDIYRHMYQQLFVTIIFNDHILYSIIDTNYKIILFIIVFIYFQIIKTKMHSQDIEDDLINQDQETFELSENQYNVQDNDQEPMQLNLFFTLITIIKSIIGAGILGFPLVFATFGWAYSIILIFIVAFFNQITCILLIKSKNISKRSNYSTIGQSIFETAIIKKIIKVFIHIIVIVSNFGACFAYIFFLTETISQVWPNPKYTYQIVIAIVGIILYFLSIIKNIQKLRFASLLGIIATIIYMILMLISTLLCFSQKKLKKLPCAFQSLDLSSVGKIPAILFAYSYQTNFFPIFKSIQQRNNQKMIKSSKISIIISSFVYIIFGLLGCIIIGNNLDYYNSPNFILILNQRLKQYKQPDQLRYILIITILVSLICNFPYFFFSVRNNLLALIQFIFPPEQRIIINDTDRDALRFRIKKIFFFVFTFILQASILLGAVIIAIREPSTDILNIMGSIADNTICFIIPTSLYCMLIIKKNQRKTKYFYVAGLIFLISLPFGMSAIIIKQKYDKTLS